MSEPGWPADGSCPGRSGETAPLLALEQVAYTAYRPRSIITASIWTRRSTPRTPRCVPFSNPRV